MPSKRVEIKFVFEIKVPTHEGPLNAPAQPNCYYGTLLVSLESNRLSSPLLRPDCSDSYNAQYAHQGVV